jgi:SAM-dependent methyltransferase
VSLGRRVELRRIGFWCQSTMSRAGIVAPMSLSEHPGIQERILWRIELLGSRGLEIGALHNPRVRKDEANIRYLDHASKEELRAKYIGNASAEPHAGKLVDVDFVWTPGKTLLNVLGDWAPVDYVIASHVVEHVPNPVQWLRDISAILRPGGTLSLVIPDKRYCFDARRRLTDLAQLLDLYLRHVEVTTCHQIFDHESNFLGDVTAKSLWDGLDPESIIRKDVASPQGFAWERCLEQAASGAYFDVHASTFTPASFVSLLSSLGELDLTDFVVSEVFPTEQGSYEFFVTLEKSMLDSSARSRTQRAAAATAARKVVEWEDNLSREGPIKFDTVSRPSDVFPISCRERRLIEMKRWILQNLRLLRRR